MFHLMLKNNAIIWTHDAAAVFKCCLCLMTFIRVVCVCLCLEYYPNCEVMFMGMANIHAIRNSFQALRTVCSQIPDPGK